MKTTKQLLKLLLAKGEELAVTKKGTNAASMCWWKDLLRLQGIIITYEEYTKLHNFILSHRPTEGEFYDKEFSNSEYFWSPYDFDIRITWIKYHIRRRLW